MRRIHGILGDETGLPRPPVYLTVYRARRRPRGPRLVALGLALAALAGLAVLWR